MQSEKKKAKGGKSLLRPGAVVGTRYRVLCVLGRGGTGTVYLVRHETLGIERALKEVSREDCVYYQSVRQRMIREIHILKQLDHPNLPEIVDIIMGENAFYIVMEYIQGKTLREIVEERGKVEEKQAVEWGRQICDVLFYLHTRKPPVIYRDLKPSNLMQKPDGRIVLIDFGTAKEYAADREDTVCLGTRGYAAPEQYDQRARIDVRTDIYCLGATLCHLVTGEIPAAVCGVDSVRRKIPNLSPGMEELICLCMRQDPAERYQNCREVRYALDHLDRNTRKYRRGERRKLFLFSALLAGAAVCCGGAALCGVRAERILTDGALVHVRQAEQSASRDTAKRDYVRALELMPSEKRIYESMQQMYIRVNDFREEDAAALLSILETAKQPETGIPVLEILRKDDPAAYCAFCYEMGIGYFYHMKSSFGKREAQIWFRNVCETADEEGTMEGFSAARRKRALLYGKISEYYNTFLSAGADSSGEKENAGYEEFFRTLQELNRITVHRESSPSHMAAVSMISMEVAVELGNFALQFQSEGGISEGEIQKELDKICVMNEKGEVEGRLKILREYREEEEVENLKNLVLDAANRNRLAAQELRQRKQADNAGTAAAGEGR